MIEDVFLFGGEYYDPEDIATAFSYEGSHNYSEYEKTKQEKKEAFLSLPISVRFERNRELRLEGLSSVGYITPDEAETFRGKLVNLPTGNRELAIAYYLLGVEVSPSTEENETIREIVNSYNHSRREAYLNGASISETFYRERDKFVNELNKARIEAKIKKAETFVGVRRERMRAKLLKMYPAFFAFSLLEDEAEGDLNSIPYLRAKLKEYGYREGDTLTDRDREAIDKASAYYLNLMELCTLNGEVLVRENEYKSLTDEEGRFKEDYSYRDEIDEALIPNEAFATFFSFALFRYYCDLTGKEAVAYLEECYEYAKKENLIKTLTGTKFESLIGE